MSRSVTIRRSLLFNLGVLVLGLCLAIVAVTVYTGNQLVAIASRRLIDRTLDRSAVQVGSFFEPVERNLRMARGWLETGVLAPQDDAALNAVFLPLLEAYPQISSVNLGDADGRNWMLLRTADGWLNRRVEPGRPMRLRTWSAGAPSGPGAWGEAADQERYDPRTREWYVVAREGAAAREPGAARPEGVYWTDAYEFFTTREPGLTATVHVAAPTGRWLLAFDVLLRDVSAFTQAIEVTKNGFVGVLSGDRRLLGVPRLPQLSTEAAVRDALLKRPRELGIDILDDAISAYQGQPGAVPGRYRDTVFSFESGGERYWADVLVVPVPPDQQVLIVVNVPERDLLGPIRQLRAGVLGAAAIAMLAAIGSAFLLARRYSAPLTDLARGSARIRRLDLRGSEPVHSGITEIAQLAGAQESMRTALDAFSRYVPTDVVRELVELGEAARIGGERKTLTVLFTDIEGFTRIAEGKSPEELTHHLAAYFAALLPILDEVGTVDKLVGDGIMAFWGAPYPDPHHARHAVEAVLACQERLDELNAGWLASDEPALPTRFGLASGPALVGNVGSERRLSYTAVGDVVNLASRLEGLNRRYGTRVLAASPIPGLAGEAFAWREVDRVRVVGRAQAVDIHELLGHRDGVERARLAFARRYETALGRYRARAFAEALESLSGLAGPYRNDASVELLREACTSCLETPPAAEWEPVTLLERK